MIDLVYKTLLAIVNKNTQGNVIPREFNVLAKLIQDEIFRGYFEDENIDKNRENRGLTNPGYSNLTFNQRQRINQFSAISTLPLNETTNRYDLPEDLYFLEDDGLTTSSGVVIEEVERQALGYLGRSIAKPTALYPIYERYEDELVLLPSLRDTLGLDMTTITIDSTTVTIDTTSTPESIICRYIRRPRNPNWTYMSVGNGELFDPTNPSFQDFELHTSEFSNIVLRMLTHFGINLREGEVIQVAESLRDKVNIKDNA